MGISKNYCFEKLIKTDQIIIGDVCAICIIFCMGYYLPRCTFVYVYMNEDYTK